MTTSEVPDAPFGDGPPVFALAGAVALTERPLQPDEVWIGDVDGEAHAILTTSHSLSIRLMSEVERLLHHMISAIEVCCGTDAFVALLGVTDARLDDVFEELAWLFLAPPPQANVAVDVGGTPVRCLALSYGGVTFAAPTNARRWPFLVARPTGEDPTRPWPRVERFRRG
ncbi:hypothetical protein [Nocardioides stalactiti]|uniref:hypothetical protein n=1 Tax=Nocardioides stalactiti TaxID=2755356 RepID=UPI001601FA9C|nr:hypothetical protein [Nocardioides stalactiti]